jgi:acetyl esterase/lipase
MLMGTLRLSLVGTVILMLLGGLSGAVLAQSEVPDEDITYPKLTRFLEYGDHPNQIIHVYELEPRAEPRPAVVFFHGGGLVLGQPLQDDEWAKWVAGQGYVTFLAGYRLFREHSGANPWPAQLDDAQRAIRWVRAHADEFNVDPTRVCAIGHSSGGQLAGLVGTTETSDDSDPGLAGVSSRVGCVVSISGDVDFMVSSDDPEWTEMVRNPIFGGTVEEVPEVWQSASPAHNVDEDTVPFLVIHGSLDEGVSIEAARNLAAALAEAGREFAYAEVPADHFDVLDLAATRRLQEAFLAYQLHPEE